MDVKEVEGGGSSLCRRINAQGQRRTHSLCIRPDLSGAILAIAAFALWNRWRPTTAITILNSRKRQLRRLAADGSPLNLFRNFRIGVERRVVTISRGPRSGCIQLSVGRPNHIFPGRDQFFEASFPFRPERVVFNCRANLISVRISLRRKSIESISI